MKKTRGIAFELHLKNLSILLNPITTFGILISAVIHPNIPPLFFTIFFLHSHNLVVCDLYTIKNHYQSLVLPSRFLCQCVVYFFLVLTFHFELFVLLIFVFASCQIYHFFQLLYSEYLLYFYIFIYSTTSTDLV